MFVIKLSSKMRFPRFSLQTPSLTSQSDGCCFLNFTVRMYTLKTRVVLKEEVSSNHDDDDDNNNYNDSDDFSNNDTKNIMIMTL